MIQSHVPWQRWNKAVVSFDQSWSFSWSVPQSCKRQRLDQGVIFIDDDQEPENVSPGPLSWTNSQKAGMASPCCVSNITIITPACAYYFSYTPCLDQPPLSPLGGAKRLHVEWLCLVWFLNYACSVFYYDVTVSWCSQSETSSWPSKSRNIIGIYILLTGT